jgi:hypothetical protein
MARIERTRQMVCGIVFLGVVATAWQATAQPSATAGSRTTAARVVLTRGAVKAKGSTGAPKARRLRVGDEVSLPAEVRTGKKGGAKLLLAQGGVVRLGASSRVALEVESGRGGAVVVKEGRAEVSCPSGQPLEISVDETLRARVDGGQARVEAAATQRARLCAMAGEVAVWGVVEKEAEPKAAPEPEAKAESEAGKKAAPEPAAEADGAEELLQEPKRPEPEPSWQPLAAGRCWRLAGRKSVEATSQDRQEMLSELCPPASVELDMPLEPVLPKGKKRGGGAEGSGGSESVSAGAGGSMCLDSSGSGPGASNVQQGPSGIQKPPPATHLKLRVKLPWKSMQR